MAKRGSTKDLSVQQEDEVAVAYRGMRSKSSGGASHDQGDVRCLLSLIECKMTGSPAKPMKRKPTILKEFEKIAAEAYSEGRCPGLALRFYEPASPLANLEGWVDLVVRTQGDDAEREEYYCIVTKVDRA